MQQELDKESGALVDEVAKQLESQALEEKERDDDDEGKHWFSALLQKTEKATFMVFFKDFFLLMCLCKCWHVVHSVHASLTFRDHRRVLDTWNCSYRQF